MEKLASSLHQKKQRLQSFTYKIKLQTQTHKDGTATSF
jgi:hypothetical protein